MKIKKMKQFLFILASMLWSASALWAQPVLVRAVFLSKERDAGKQPLYRYADTLLAVAEQSKLPSNCEFMQQRHWRIAGRKYVLMSFVPRAKIGAMPAEWCDVSMYVPNEMGDSLELRRKEFSLRLSLKEQKMLCRSTERPRTAGSDNTTSIADMQATLRALRNNCSQAIAAENEAQSAFSQRIAQDAKAELWRELILHDRAIARHLALYQMHKRKEDVQMVATATAAKTETLKKIGKPDADVEKLYQTLSMSISQAQQACAEVDKLKDELERRGVKVD